MRSKTIRKLLLRTLAPLFAMLALYCLLLAFPMPFFQSSVSANNLSLYSDQPFSAESGKNVLEKVAAKLGRSPLYSPSQSHAAFICNGRWRQRLFFNRNYGVGGLNQYPLTRNVFLSGALIDRDCLISPSGREVEGDRTLDYFIAHEITHTLTAQALGSIHYYKLAQWVREGYADYVGKGDAFNYDEARRAFMAGAPEMDWRASGLYMRYHLLVAHLLDKEHWTVQQLLDNPPEQAAVENEVRAEGR